MVRVRGGREGCRAAHIGEDNKAIYIVFEAVAPVVDRAVELQGENRWGVKAQD